MKEGTGGDPFADDLTDSEPATEPDPEPETEIASTTESGTDSESETSSTPETTTVPDLPYIYRRDTVKEDRDQVPFFLRDHVRDLEDEFIDNLEDRLETNVYKADAREAALEIVYENHVAEAAERLRDWGYDKK